MRVTLLCDKSADSLKFIDQTFFKKECTIELRYSSKAGCPVITQGAIGAFVDHNKIPVAATMIAVGIFLTFFGLKFVDIVIFLVSASAIGFGAAYGGFMFLDSKVENSASWMTYGVLGVAAILGLCCGLYIMKVKKFGIPLIAGFGGAALGGALSTALLISSQMIHWVIVGACALAAVIIAGWVQTLVIVLGTSFIGSYMAVRGISMFAGGYPNEFILVEQIEKGLMTWESFPKIFFAYLAGIVVLTILGVCFQFKHEKKSSNNNN